MNTATPKSRNKPSAAARAEAAAWIARLHGPNRTPEVEAGWRRWMAEDPARAAAFEFVTDTWDKSARLRRRPMEQVASWQSPGLRISVSRAALATAAVAVLAVVGTTLYLRTDALATAVGEQRTLTLEDGTRVHLNTNSRVHVRYTEAVRRIELEQGEALFDVARRADRPFVVVAGDREIRALGTSFIVRRDERKLAVTLVEGKVAVSRAGMNSGAIPGDSRMPATDQPAAAQIVAKDRTRAAENKPTFDARVASAEVLLAPGQRLTFAGGAPPQLDTPPLDKVTAWQRGQVAFDNTVLADAVAEMNRYSAVRVVVVDPEAAAIPVSGVFRAGDTANFAQALARTYGLRVQDDLREIVLAGKPTHR